MQWSYDTPTDSGNYYHKQSNNDEPALVYVDFSSIGGYMIHMACTELHRIPMRIVDQWLGPITPESVMDKRFVKINMWGDLQYFSRHTIKRLIHEINNNINDSVTII